MKTILKWSSNMRSLWSHFLNKKILALVFRCWSANLFIPGDRKLFMDRTLDGTLFIASKNCTLKQSPLANTLRRRDKLFICLNNICASVEKPGDTYTTTGLNTTTVDEYETANVTFVTASCWKEKKKMRESRMTGCEGRYGIKRRKTFAGCTLRRGCRAQEGREGGRMNSDEGIGGWDGW